MTDLITSKEIVLAWNSSLSPTEIHKRTPQLELLVETLLAYKKAHNDILGVGIFGSFLRPDFNPNSDIDFVCIEDEEPPSEGIVLSDEHFRIYKERSDREDLPKQWFARTAEKITGNPNLDDSCRTGGMLTDVEYYQEFLSALKEGQVDYRVKRYLGLMHEPLYPAIISTKNRRFIDEAIFDRMRKIPDDAKRWAWGHIKMDYDEFIFRRNYHGDKIVSDIEPNFILWRDRLRHSHGGQKGYYLDLVKKTEEQYRHQSSEFDLGYVSNDPRLLTGFDDFIRRVERAGTHFLELGK